MYQELTDHFEVKSDIDRTWEFFSNAANLPLITPPWLKFTIAMNALPRIEQETVLDYTIRWCGLPIRWQTRIIDFTPKRQFIDLQTKGPYALWHHQHTFEPSDNGVICFDRVFYQLPVPGIRRIVHATIVRKQLTEIFRFRRRVIGEHLGWVRALQDDIRIEPLN